MSLSTTTTSTLTGALAALRVSLPAVDLPLPPSCPTTESNVVVDGSAASQSSKPAWIRTSKPAESSPLVLGTDSSSWPALTESTTRKTNSDEGDGSTHTDGAPVSSMAMPIIRPPCLQPSPRARGNSNQGSAYNGGGGNRRGGGVVPHHGNFGGRPYHNSGSYDMCPHHNFGFGGWEVRAPPLQYPGPQPPFRGPPMPALAPPQHRGHPLPRQRPPPPLNYPVPFTVQPTYVPPYMNPMGFQGILPPPQLPHLQIFSHPHAELPPVFIPGTDAHRAELLRQVHFYFSYQNLCKDVYLRQYMDENGWVPISLIAGFNCVRNLTNDIRYILDVLRTSTIVEVQGYKIRLRNNWKFWILPSTLSKTWSPD